jgi:hypoxanthine phosphoribosyltransferase
MKKLFTETQIQNQINFIANQINSAHYGDDIPIVMVGILNGSFMFYSDLLKMIEVDVRCDFIRAKSYNGKKSGIVNVIKNLEVPVYNSYVYLIDDIYDTGNTLNHLINLIPTPDLSQITVVSLLKRYNSPPLPDKVSHLNGFEINNEWVFGYGMDNEQGYKRNLNEIWYF